MQYTIVRAKSLEDLITQVNESFKQEWKPLGGVAVEAATVTGTGRTLAIYFQSLVKGS